MSDLVSGEAVLLELRVARLASRGLAFVLDVLIQGVTLLITFLVLGANDIGGFDDALGSAITLAVLVIVLIGYPAATETLTRGRTVGKLALGLRTVRTDGGPIRLRHALVRALAGFFVDFWGVGLFGAVAVIVSLSSRNGQRVGDLLAGTFVIRERVPAQRAAAVHMPGPLAAWAAEQRVSLLPNDLALAVRQYLGRLAELSPQAAAHLGHRLADEVSSRLGTPVPPGVPVDAYLAAVLAERRDREEARSRQPGLPPAGRPEEPSRDRPDPTTGPFAPPG
ncbi:MAG: RDD family protein [Kibdelosporangium sp.]